MTIKTLVPLKTALRVARILVEELAPYCERTPEIAGSIRRKKEAVGDIELVCISNFYAEQRDLFGNPTAGYPLLDSHISDLIQRGFFEYRLKSNGQRTFGPLNKLLVHVESGISVDVFSTTTKNWGMTLFIRTGPRDYNIRAMTQLHWKGLEGHAYGGITDTDGREIPCPKEEDVYRHLGWAWESPENRE